MTPEEAVALLLDIARKGMLIDALRQRCADLESQLAAKAKEVSDVPNMQ